MPDLKLMVAGLAMGLAIAAPLGPVNIMVIRQVLARGRAAGLVTGLGAVAADSFFAAVAAFGLQSVEQFFAARASTIGLAGGTLLVVIGILTARHHIAGLANAGTLGRPWQTAVAAFTTTLTNPGAIIGVFAVFAAMANVLHLEAGGLRPLATVLAFAAGGILWWLVLGLIVASLRGRLSEAMLNRLNRWTGVLIAAFGFVLLMEVLF